MSTILVVDDQLKPRRLLIDELEDAGFEVSEASDGEEAHTEGESPRRSGWASPEPSRLAFPAGVRAPSSKHQTGTPRARARRSA